MARRFIGASGRGAALGIALAATLLAGCAALGSRVVPAGQAEFELSGRIAVRYDHEASSGNLAWRHAARADEMLITSPLGQGIARIVRSGDAVTLTTSDDRRYRASDAEALTEKVLGFRVPLRGLADWVRGRPEPGNAAQTRYDADGRLVELEQSGWRIEYLAYAADGKLPSRLKLTYPGLELLLAINEWRAAP
ncbi:MAG: lipoprotein insertase outer membrane protein LolB [Betaproteobacteria bacterium]|nr:lipoprotein insertase outer membrane protein LolB [Betaproteobacteria bacterium]